MTTRSVARRSVLGGLAGMGLVPFLEQRQAKGAASPMRLVVLTNNQGTTLSKWRPTQTGSNFSMTPLLEPLTPFKAKLNVLSGICNKIKENYLNGSHIESCVTLMTANIRSDPQNQSPALGPSVEQVIASRIKGSARLTSFDSRIGVDFDDGPMFHVSSGNPVGSEPDPRIAWNRLSGFVPTAGSAPPAPTAKDRLRRNRKGVLDYVSQELDRAKAKVGSADRQRLEAHTARLSEMNAEMAKLDNATAGTPLFGCTRSNVSLPAGFSPYTQATIDLAAKAHCQNIAMALSCDISRVATLQDVFGNPSLKWLGINSFGGVADFHGLVHEKGVSAPDTLFAGYKWNATVVAYLLQQMDSINEGDGTLLDNSLVLWINQFGEGSNHNCDDLPIVLAGGLGKRIQTGRHLAFTGRTTNDLFVTLLRLFGGNDTTFGHGGSDTNKGPLSL
jgi:hypothetical protein